MTDTPKKVTPQIVEVNGSESPSTVRWNAKNNRARQDLSRARLRAIECSLENGQVWAPPSLSHRKTWEEEVLLCVITFTLFDISIFFLYYGLSCYPFGKELLQNDY